MAERLHPLEPWEVSIVASATGTVPHLIETRELDNAKTPRALCGVGAKRPTRISFAARGCLRCCRVALQAGLKIVVVGPDDQLVDLHEVRRNGQPPDERRV
ncbi:hypothetical protein GCM10023350_07050 [Nocardioides endophyticus]|uniref:Uncharacterized protein n=1 Tax=Nocardioides endophyticus TaxID=1353775 RepID=A0ABP8YFW9_9ACTN